MAAAVESAPSMMQADWREVLLLLSFVGGMQVGGQRGVKRGS